MKKILILIALPAAAFAAESAPSQDAQAAVLFRQQRDASNQQLSDLQVQLALTQKQLDAANAKVADLQKQIEAAKPKPTAPAKK